MLKKAPLRKKNTLKCVPGALRAKKPVTGQIGANKKLSKPKKKAWKFVKTHLVECDDVFSREVRDRDRHCLFPGCETTYHLTCSHYIGRANWNTRFDEDNCITLCTTHHFWDKTIGWEYQKQRKGVKGCDWDGRYTLFMMSFLGETRWNALLERAKGEKTRKEAILETQKKYNLRQPKDLGEPT
jgi:hypothetical protein